MTAIEKLSGLAAQGVLVTIIYLNPVWRQVLTETPWLRQIRHGETAHPFRMCRVIVVSGSERRFPRSLIEFRDRFATESACAQYLFERRWPEGFVCPGCGGGRAWLLQTKAFTFECADCGRQTSVTAGTIMHASKLPLTIWFWAAFLMATHSNGISALQLQNQLGLGSYRTAWML